MLKSTRLLLLSLLVLAPISLTAQDGQAARQEQNQPEKKQQQVQQERDPNKEKQHGAAESFKPSEQISEDLSVSFPVDI